MNQPGEGDHQIQIQLDSVELQWNDGGTVERHPFWFLVAIIVRFE